VRQPQLGQILLVTGFIWLGVSIEAIAQPVPSLDKSKSIVRILHDSQATKETSLLSEVKRPLTSAQLLVQSPISEIVQVTAVEANLTEQGVEVILQTTLGEQLSVVNRSSGNSYIADIPNAQLRLRNGEAFVFRSQKPITGITEITVTNANANTIRVTVAGEAGMPTVELFDSTEEGLIFGVVSASVSKPQGQQPPIQPTPQPVEPKNETQRTELSAEENELIEVVVTGEQETGYSVPNATSATRTDTPLRDIPQSIQVVPQQVLEEQQVTRIGDAARNVSGVTPKPGYAGATDNYTIRGFEASNNLRNGFRDDGFYSFTDPANIERVEVLKGPASVLYGQIEPGGVVNYVTKQPLNEPYYAGEFTVGSYDFYRPSIDISGPLNSDETLLYRLNVAYENSGSFRDFVDKELFIIAPVLSYKISDATTLTLEYEYINLNQTFDRAFPPIRETFDLPLAVI